MEEFKLFVKKFKEVIAKDRGFENKSYDLNKVETMEKILPLFDDVKYDLPENIEKRDGNWLWIIHTPPIWFFFHSLRKEIENKLSADNCFGLWRSFTIHKFYSWIYKKNRRTTIELFIECCGVLYNTEHKKICEMPLIENYTGKHKCTEELFVYRKSLYGAMIVLLWEKKRGCRMCSTYKTKII